MKYSYSHLRNQHKEGSGSSHVRLSVASQISLLAFIYYASVNKSKENQSDS